MEPTRRHLIRYLPDDVTVESQGRETILATSLRAGVPHIYECGGTARCSTCRVLVVDGVDRLTRRTPREKAVGEQLHFEPAIRLACQTRPTGDVTVRRLVLDDLDVKLTSLVQSGSSRIGREATMTVLFSDIRGFTAFSEKLLPYDVINILERYFLRMGNIVERHGGKVDKVMGDGLMALFGVDDAPNGTMQAVRAALEMLDELERLKPYVRSVAGQSFEIGIGIHSGPVVVGTLGTQARPQVTVIGDTVNVASRVEAANKVTGTHLLISASSYDDVREQVTVGRTFRLALPGKSGEHELYEIIGTRPDRTPGTLGGSSATSALRDAPAMPLSG